MFLLNTDILQLVLKQHSLYTTQKTTIPFLTVPKCQHVLGNYKPEREDLKSFRWTFIHFIQAAIPSLPHKHKHVLIYGTPVAEITKGMNEHTDSKLMHNQVMPLQNVFPLPSQKLPPFSTNAMCKLHPFLVGTVSLSKGLGFRPSYRTAVEFAIHVITEFARIVIWMGTQKQGKQRRCRTMPIFCTRFNTEKLLCHCRGRGEQQAGVI